MADNTTGISAESLDTNIIKGWKSIVTLVVFILTNLTVVFPFHITIPIRPRAWNAAKNVLEKWRVVPPSPDDNEGSKFIFPMNLVTAPLVADLLLLATTIIGATEVRDGTVGANGIFPLDIMAFFITLAYVAISIDASGVIRKLALMVLKWGRDFGSQRDTGAWLFFLLYVFFFGLGSFIGNDPLILSGTAFIAYMYHCSHSIREPDAWIYTQFAVANMASAILVSSNPTNLVLASAFQITFLAYTANMIVPVVVTAILLFPFLLYVRFDNRSTIPDKIEVENLGEEVDETQLVDPSIPFATDATRVSGKDQELSEQDKEIMRQALIHPFHDSKSSKFGAVVMALVLIALLALNASGKEKPVFYVTLPGAFIMLCWDLSFGWKDRHKTRELAEKNKRVWDEEMLEEARRQRLNNTEGTEMTEMTTASATIQRGAAEVPSSEASIPGHQTENAEIKQDLGAVREMSSRQEIPDNFDERGTETQKLNEIQRNTLVSLAKSGFWWARITFPRATTVLMELPYALVPFALCTFILVEALVSKGWVLVFAYGWDHWVNKTGTMGAISGMAFLSVILCNLAGTNIGATILLSRVVQSWTDIHKQPNQLPISDRTFWATVYSMALGVNFGAFSATFNAALAGLLWRKILSEKRIEVRPLDFTRVNLPIIAVAMSVGCLVLVGEVYIIRSADKPFSL